MTLKDTAQERLQSFYNPNHLADQIVRLEKLPARLSTMGQILIQTGPAWKKLQKNMSARNRLRRDAIGDVATLNEQERRNLFAALFPGIAPYVEATWKLFDSLPYPSGHQRRPFRNPGSANLEARIAWLHGLPYAVRGYEHQDILWFAAWASHLGYWGPNTLGYLFASAIDEGGQTGNEVFQILVSSANGTHEIGVMGRQVVRGLLCAARPDGWDYIERMLLAAQREEGLRQVILEAVDEAHPQAFRRMLRLALDHNLIRFSATIRAFSVWFGLPFEAANPKAVHNVLEQVLRYLDSPAECERAVRMGEAQAVYIALWALAIDDVMAALPHAVALSRSSNVEKRFAAIHLLGQLGLQECLPELLTALDDEDLRIPAHALSGITATGYDHDLLSSSDMFERLERLLPRVRHKQNTLKPLVWDWLPVSLDREAVSGKLIDCLGPRSPKRLLPYLSLMNPRDRWRAARVLRELKRKDDEILQTLLSLAGDRSPDVREEALKGLHGIALKDADIARLEELLARQSQDLRRGILQLLLALPDRKLVESVHRLIHHKGDKQRLAALEILRECKRNQRASNQLQRLALAYRESAAPSHAEANLLDEILADAMEEFTLDNSLGLMNPQNRTRPVPVKAGSPSARVKLATPASLDCLKFLDALVDEHRNDVLEIERGDGKVTELLGNIRWRWMLHSEGHSRDFSGFPLKDLAASWRQTRSQGLRDQDGLEMIRAMALVSLFRPRWNFLGKQEDRVAMELQRHFDVRLDFVLKYSEIVHAMVEWLVWLHPVEGETDFILNALAESVGRIPHRELTGLKDLHAGMKVRTLNSDKLAYLEVARWQRGVRSDAWKDHHHARLWKIVCWLNEPEPGLPGAYTELEDALLAFQCGAATRDDLFQLFLGPHKQDGYGVRFDLLQQFSARKLHPHQLAQLEQFPVIREIVDACRERILEVECKRGELPTAATAPANSLRSVPGMRNLFRMLAALGDSGFERGYRRGQSRSGAFSHLIRNSYPVETDSPDDFMEQARLHHIPNKRLIELSVYAPQWAAFVERAVGWNHLTDAVWWLYAHTKDRQWTVEADIRDEWAARISEHTPLSADDLMDGAVDVAWFQRVYSEMGEARWSQLYDAASYASGGIGHGRARLFADAMLGRVAAEELFERIRRKRHQDSVRALGLIPLAESADRKHEILGRYEIMQEFLRTGRKFGSQRQASERLAVAIGMQNLARTAGYADPQRLEWAMEIEAVKDLSSGPVDVETADFRFSLAINELGEPALVTLKKGKPIKTIPAAIKKNERVSTLLDRKQKLERQVSRMRLSLELAMCRGDEFEASELKTLFRHPMLKAMLEQLVFVSSHGLGYPVRSGNALYRYDGREVALAGADRLRIAHPLDLFESREWHLWQRECFVAERIQPFKQIFRELYVLTAAEKEEGHLSRRYAEQQVNPRQALALFGGRGWVADPNEGVQKTFHREGISARVEFLQGMFTPAEVEGLTIEAVGFTKRGEWKTLKLAEIPPRVFSEVMRDLDLVVSVAHAGGVDPESSASSIEARAALIRETAVWLALTNVRVSERHAIIDGKLSNYNVNLGSGVVHKQPGGALCIIPVHSQHRGRLFLPFVDNDPKTAEIISKVILLARDDQIKDPTILEQIL